VTLDFLAAQQRQSLTELGALRDDMRVLTAIGMVAQHRRTADLVRTIKGFRE